MAYTYHVDFTVENAQMEQFQIGAALEKVVGYLRTLLPNQPGFITARGMHSLDGTGATHLVVQSMWDQWDDLKAHQDSGLAEQKVLAEFGPHVSADHLSVRIYEEVA